jgi:hypothetical protein
MERRLLASSALWGATSGGGTRQGDIGPGGEQLTTYREQ